MQTTKQQTLMTTTSLTKQLIHLLLVFLCCFPATLQAATEIDDSQEMYQGIGIDPNRSNFGTTGSENIDPFAGALTLTYTDLILPGNGGLDLAINRIYRSKNGYKGSHQAMDSYVSMPFGWDIHFGELKKNGDVITVELADGTSHYAFKVPTAMTTEYLTKDFDKVTFPTAVGVNIVFA